MKKICIVEDNTAIRKLFATILSKKGYEVSDFSNGESFLKGVVDAKPDLMILDILLPDINGTALIGNVRAIPEFKSTPVIAVTGFATAQDEIKFKELGFSSYLSKPINTEAFLDEVKRLVS
jgi:two-component system cell cycle response regulator DivK